MVGLRTIKSWYSVCALFQVGLKFKESVVIRVTGCPNGCARPYMAELGLVGDGPNSYQVRKKAFGVI